MRVAVLGGGVMGETLASAFTSADPGIDLVVAERLPERAADLASRLGLTLAEPADAVRGAEVVVLVVKPQDTRALLDEIGAHIAPGALVISIAAGITTATIEAAVAQGVNVVRAMPNTPALLGQGVTGISAGAGCSVEALASAEQLMGNVGLVVVVPESLQDAVTAVSGSGPAYVFYLAEAMVSAGEQLGLDTETATRMVSQTLMGAAMLLSSSPESAAELRRRVTSPGGTTAAAIATLDDHSVRADIVAALVAARDRSRELSG